LNTIEAIKTTAEKEKELV